RGSWGASPSSSRDNRAIKDMGPASEALLKMRPVTFRYNSEPQGTVQYGLVAEEVAKLYPELVSYGTDGKPQTVHYLELTAMLLNELQKQARQNQRQAELIQHLSEQSQVQAAQNRSLATEVAQLKSMVEPVLRAQRDGHSLAATFHRYPQ